MALGSLLIALALPSAAAAHLRSGTVAVDYRATVSNPVTAAYSVRIFQSDRGLAMTLKPGHVVILIGYLGETVFRLDSVGLWINRSSPTAVVAGLLPKKQRAPSGWQLERGHRYVAWHDARAQGLPPGVSHGRWLVPLIVDGRRTALTGELVRFPAPSLLPWLVLALLLLAVAASTVPPWRRARLPAIGTGLAAVAGAGATIACIGLCLDAYASPGTWIVGIDAFVFLAVGFGALLRGPRHLRLAAAGGIGCVSLAVGLLNGAVFRHAIVLAVLPATPMRLAITAAVAAGLAAAALGCLYYTETLRGMFDHEDEFDFATAPLHGPAP